jgi:putative transposase
MGRNRFKIFENSYPYLVTSTIVEWMPLFGIKKVTEIIIDSLKFMLSNSRLEIYGYVIMENHLHLIVQADDLGKEIGDFKSFTARKIIEHLTEHHYNEILARLEHFKLSHKTDRKYQFWQEGFHPEQIFSREMMSEKLNYMNNNPLRRGYVDDATHWTYSSARNYAGLTGIINVRVDWW